MCEGASKQILNLKILARRDRAPPFWNSWIRYWKVTNPLLLVEYKGIAIIVKINNVKFTMIN